MRKKSILVAITGLAISAISATGEDKINFAEQIYPFVKESCVKCHQPEYEDERGRTRRPKADLVITSKEAFLAGGENGDVVVAGEPTKSPFLQRTLLPLDDDEHMPPEDKAEQWTDAQKELFTQWIKEGADFGDWTEDKELPVK